MYVEARVIDGVGDVNLHKCRPQMQSLHRHSSGWFWTLDKTALLVISIVRLGLADLDRGVLKLASPKSYLLDYFLLLLL